MNDRQILIEDWHQKLAAASSNLSTDRRQFGWVRQIYTRIFRFLTSRYGDGDWRSDARSDDRSARTTTNASIAQLGSTTSEFSGLQPKQPERIRETLNSIHENGSGIATVGATTLTNEDTWVVVGAYKKTSHARAVRKRLRFVGIEACLQHRAGDTAALVRRDDFHDAMAIVRRPVVSTSRTMMVSVKPSAANVVSSTLLVWTAATMVFVATVTEHRFWALLALWCVGLAALWLCFSRSDSDAP